jgi:hypothetical protein
MNAVSDKELQALKRAVVQPNDGTLGRSRPGSGWRPVKLLCTGLAELAKACSDDVVGKLVRVGECWRSRPIAVWSVITGQVNSMLSHCRCDSNCNSCAREPRFYTFCRQLSLGSALPNGHWRHCFEHRFSSVCCTLGGSHTRILNILTLVYNQLLC